MSDKDLSEIMLKYGLTQDDLAEIMAKTAPSTQQPPTATQQLLQGDLDGPLDLQFLGKAMGGEIGIVEALLIMDYMDRKEERKRRLDREENNPRQNNDIRDVLEELRKEREERRAEIAQQKSHFEQLFMTNKLTEAQSTINLQAKQIEGFQTQENEKRKEAELYDYLEQRLSQYQQYYGSMQPQARKGILDEVFSEVEDEISQDLKKYIRDRLSGSSRDDARTSGAINYQANIERFFDIMEQFAKRGKEKPELQEVTPIPSPHGAAEQDISPAPESTQVEQPESPSPTPPIEVVSVEPVIEPTPPVNTIQSGMIHGMPEGYIPPAMPYTPPPTKTRPPIDRSKIHGAIMPPTDLTNISGIGPQYAERLQHAGVSNIAALADKSVEEIALSLDIPSGKAEDWIKQAKDLVDAS